MPKMLIFELQGRTLGVLTAVTWCDRKFLVSYKSTQTHLVLVSASPVRHLLT